ncbi:hypothetical protein I552_0215 [Mycobacterium xenopi 3993]|nr:hypothetical protein I552_0215 [Mycobacterium xenopi 3993]
MDCLGLCFFALLWCRVQRAPTATGALATARRASPRRARGRDGYRAELLAGGWRR